MGSLFFLVHILAPYAKINSGVFAFLKKKNMKIYLIFLLNISIIGTMIVGIFSVYAGANPFTLRYKNAHTISKLIPEGWGFFTRNPREPIYRFYECQDGKLEEINLNNNSLNSLAGLSRINRRGNLELQRMKHLVPDSLYIEGKQLDCIADDNVYHIIEDDRGFDYHYVKNNGLYAVSVEKVKPWLYANQNISYDNNFKSLLITLLCDSNAILFDKDLFGYNTINSFADNINLFFLFGYEHIWIAEIISVIVLLWVISGYFPYITGILHWWVAFSFCNAASLADGGEQVAAVLLFFLIPVTLLDRRKNHYHSPKEHSIGRRYVSSMTLKFIIPIQMGILYMHAFTDKLYKLEEWRNGTAVYYFSKDPLFGGGTIENLNLFSSTFFVTSATWGTLLLELCLAGALFMSYNSKKWMLPFGVLFHFLISVMFGLWSFMFSMIGGLIIYLILPEKNLNIMGGKSLTQTLQMSLVARVSCIAITFLIMTMSIFGLYTNVIDLSDAVFLAIIALVPTAIYLQSVYQQKKKPQRWVGNVSMKTNA